MSVSHDIGREGSRSNGTIPPLRSLLGTPPRRGQCKPPRPTASDHPAVAHVPSVEVAEGTHPLVLVLDELPTTRSRRSALMDALACLYGWLGVGADHHLAGLQQFAFPAALVEIEYPSCLLKEVGVPWEDPRTVLPGFDRVLGQPPSDRRRGRVAHTTLDNEAVDLRSTETRERNALLAWQLARDCLDLRDLFRGENDAGAPRVACPSNRPSAPQRNVFANAQRHQDSYPDAYRSAHSAHQQRRRAQAWRAGPPETSACNTQRHAQAHDTPWRSTRSSESVSPLLQRFATDNTTPPHNPTELTADST